MARPLRIEFPGALHHVTSRGNARADIVADDVDRTIFTDVLAAAVERHGWLCHAWCLMDDHYHLMVETPDANLAAGMSRLNGVFTQRLNRRHARVGHIFQGRYQAILVEREAHLLELARHLVLNPVRVGLRDSAAKWRWSSYRATAGLSARRSFEHVDGFSPASMARANTRDRSIAASSPKGGTQDAPGTSFTAVRSWAERRFERGLQNAWARRIAKCPAPPDIPHAEASKRCAGTTRNGAHG